MLRNLWYCVSLVENVSFCRDRTCLPLWSETPHNLTTAVRRTNIFLSIALVMQYTRLKLVVEVPVTVQDTLQNVPVPEPAVVTSGSQPPEQIAAKCTAATMTNNTVVAADTKHNNKRASCDTTTTESVHTSSIPLVHITSSIDNLTSAFKTFYRNTHTCTVK